MKSIRRTDYAILLISDAFLKSANCMFEVMELLKDEDYKKRILPILIGDVSLNNSLARLHYVKYWENEIEKLNKSIKSLNNISNIDGLIEELKHYNNEPLAKLFKRAK